MKKILFAASECVPFMKTGGLADVVGALPKEFDKNDIEMVDADVNVEIDVPAINNYQDEDSSNIDIKQLEDDKNSSTGNV